ncbi:hypothetical protein Trydic_g767 [Trypoxylus dichotomus]
MRKSNPKRKIIRNNHKISSYFQSSSLCTNARKSDSTDDLTKDDVIPATPSTNEKKRKVRILTTITNTEESNKKRISDFEVTSPLDNHDIKTPPRKKFNSETENNLCNPSTSKCNQYYPSTSNVEIVTPKKSPAALISTPKKTPKSRSSEKLFSKSPTTSGFDIEVLKNFVRVTPSKSSIKSKFASPLKTSDKKQSSILKYVSPSPSKSEHIQMNNERTPEKSPTTSIQVLSQSKVKINLSLRFSPTTLQFTEDNKIDVRSSPKITETLKEIENLLDLDDSWEKYEIEHYSLDLSVPQHCTVTTCTRNEYHISICVASTKTAEKAICKLEGFWIWSKINVGCTVYLTAIKDDSNNTWKITNEHGLFVYEPDILLSNTAVVGALFCKRQSVFKEKFMGFEPENKVMVIGILIHTLLQGVLKIKTANSRKIENMLHEILSTRSTIRLMFNCSLTYEELRTELIQFVPRIVTFMEDYVIRRQNSIPSKDNWKGTIDSIQDIEENIWCPELGIKGKIDVSILSGKNIMPVELKTGRARISLEHRGQVMLYIVMMSKLGYNVSSGLLLYLREGALQEIPYNNREKRDLILLRNELTYYLTRRVQINNEVEKSNRNDARSWNQKLKALEPPELPAPINHHSACGKCPYNVICCTYLKYENADLTNNKELNSIKEQGLSHLTDLHIQYFIHFSNLLDLERHEKVGKDVSVIYTKTPEEREKIGKCITFVKITNEVIECDGLYEHTFEKSDNNDQVTTFLTSGIGESSYVIVSTSIRSAVAAGIVSFINHNTIDVILDRNLTVKYRNSIFHIDAYDSNSVFSFNFTSLSVLLETTEQANRLRRLIIDKESPTFKSKLPKIIASTAPPILKQLNRAQQRAVLKACCANDYLLIKGMPGAGKTATIIALVQLLVELNNTVLITSHTHAAVDNVCVRLKKRGINVLRLGATGRIHSDIRSMSEHELTKKCKSPKELEEVYAKAKVFAVTCLGTKHPIFNKRVMDVCIVDESTQVIQSSLFRALSASKKFILIGDPDQLPPVVKNTDAIKYGLSESLFERLQNPEATVSLNLNYRMNKPITELANSFTYLGELKVANDIIGNATFKIPNLNIFLELYREEKWLLDTLDSSLENSVKVLDTGPVWQNCRTKENNPDVNVNIYEIAVVKYIIAALVKGGIESNSIGVISPYTAQVSKLSSSLSNKDISVSTVDQFQGRDKEVIIFSCTISKDVQQPHMINQYHILEDRRRLNVAITRAKHKLILIGDLAAVKIYTPFRELLENMPSHYFVRLIDGENGFNWQALL